MEAMMNEETNEIETEIVHLLEQRSDDRLCVEALALIQRLRLPQAAKLLPIETAPTPAQGVMFENVDDFHRGGFYCYVRPNREAIEIGAMTSMNVEHARALRDWLNRALP
jgi:hypothetical protein